MSHPQPPQNPYGFAPQGQHGFGPQQGQYGYPHQYQPRPQPAQQPPQQPPVVTKQRTSPLAYALVAMIALIVVGMAALIALGFSSRSTEFSPDGTVPMPPRWANNGYEPPEIESNPDDIPWPTGLQQALTWTQENPIYDQEYAQPLKCELDDLQLRSVSDDALEEQLNAMVACLMGGWDQPMQAIDVTMPRPGLIVYDRTGVQTPCGWKDAPNALWCSGNQQLYYASHLIDSHPELAEMRFGPELIMAHEFAHYIQGRTGIAAGSYAQREGIPEEEALLLNRRHEAQADCFAGLFLNAITNYVEINETDLANFDVLMQRLGGSSPGTTHPYGPSRIHWLSVGLNTFDIGECNTYMADPDTVI